MDLINIKLFFLKQLKLMLYCIINVSNKCLAILYSFILFATILYILLINYCRFDASDYIFTGELCNVSMPKENLTCIQKTIQMNPKMTKFHNQSHYIRLHILHEEQHLNNSKISQRHVMN